MGHRHKRSKATKANNTNGPHFAHPSEAEFARILDFYRVKWQYEPRTFPLQWDKDGHVTEAFTPDFYLPDVDLYVELTTLNQRLVTKKNRKLRHLRELYPDVNIKLFYGKDFQSLMIKYELNEPASPNDHVTNATQRPGNGDTLTPPDDAAESR
ncbi:MAG: hypothetical protein A2Z04_05700 [Chloroflexi bacterium RBG_16_57_9]|nr:MAG: hypothetical protein A2Z04_05700 [Chloroflexi bacterium RBG_16_57_9]